MLSLIAITVGFFNEPKKGNVTIEEDHEAVVPVVVVDEERTEPIEKEFPFSMTEHDVQIAIHSMSHQKVKAQGDEKWDLLLMTLERIDRLIMVVEANSVKYRKNEETYLDILNRWKNNDFSRVDLDHNEVWEMQNGTRGRAIGIFTLEEEKEFIKEHFDVELK